MKMFMISWRIRIVVTFRPPLLLHCLLLCFKTYFSDLCKTNITIVVHATKPGPANYICKYLDRSWEVSRHVDPDRELYHRMAWFQVFVKIWISVFNDRSVILTEWGIWESWNLVTEYDFHRALSGGSRPPLGFYLSRDLAWLFHGALIIKKTRMYFTVLPLVESPG